MDQKLLHSLGGTLLGQVALIFTLHESKVISRQVVAEQLKMIIMCGQAESLPDETICYLQALLAAIEEMDNTPDNDQSVTRTRPSWMTVLSGGKATD